MNRLILVVTGIFFITLMGACSYKSVPVFNKQVTVIKVIEAVGYSSMSNFDKYPLPQRKLLAIRGAKLDAYRNLAEELYGVRIRSNTTVKDMMIKSDSFRSYIDAMVRGAHVNTVTAKDDGVYEVEISLSLTEDLYACITHKSIECYQQAQEESVETSGGNQMVIY